MPANMWNGKLERIELPAGGEYLMVKDRMSRGDRRRIQTQMVSSAKMRIDGTTEGIDAGVAYDQTEFATILSMTVTGMVIDENTGHLIKITEANKEEILRCLDDDSLKIIRSKMNELYPALPTEEEDLNSVGDGSSIVMGRELSPTS